jgi:hypothetical protein
MHKLLGLEKTIDHAPESAEDEEAEKLSRLAALKDYMVFLVPSLGEVKLNAGSVVPEEPNKKKARTEGEFTVSPQSHLTLANNVAVTPDPVPNFRQRTLTIIIRDGVGKEMHFKVNQSTRLQKVFDAFATRHGMCSSSFMFHFDGQRIVSDHTPAHFNMEDDDTIEATIVQAGC